MGKKRSAATALQEGGSAGNSSATPAKKKKMGKKNFYGVQAGKNVEPGIYESWADCEEMTRGVKGAIFKGFATREEAERFVAGERVVKENAYYAVARGKQTGIFRDYYKDVLPLVNVSGAKHKSFPTEAQAIQYIKENGSKEAIAALGLEAADATTNTDGIDEKKIPIEEAKPDDDNVLNIWTDGSSLGNGTPEARAGLGVFFGHGDPRNIAERLAGLQTNQRAELTAVQRALEAVPSTQDVRIITDSSYSIDCLTNWAASWISRGWRKSDGTPVMNREIIEPVIDMIAQREGRTDFRWVKGHRQDKGNLAADALANKGAAKDPVKTLEESNALEKSNALEERGTLAKREVAEETG